MIRLLNNIRRKRDKLVEIVEVGARDGLQNEQFLVPTTTKRELIERLHAAGLKAIEVTSFVSPKWVPQMADASDLFSQVMHLDARLPVLVPNEKGLEQAIAAGATDIAIFTAASDTFNQRNINCTIAESLVRLRQVVKVAQQKGIRSIRGYISCAIGCPFEGWTDPAKVDDMTAALLDMGCYEVSLGDTIGVGTAGHVRNLLDKLAKHNIADQLAVHFHDTYGQALANILVAVEEYGIRTVDCAVAGLGGCPFAPGATGNVSTEDVVYMLHGLGYETGIDLQKLVEAGRFICEAMGRQNGSRAGTALLRRQ